MATYVFGGRWLVHHLGLSELDSRRRPKEGVKWWKDIPGKMELRASSPFGHGFARGGTEKGQRERQRERMKSEGREMGLGFRTPHSIIVPFFLGRSSFIFGLKFG